MQRFRDKSRRFEEILNEALGQNQSMRRLCRQHGLFKSGPRGGPKSSGLWHTAKKTHLPSTQSREPRKPAPAPRLKALGFFEVIKKSLMFESPFSQLGRADRPGPRQKAPAQRRAPSPRGSRQSEKVGQFALRDEFKRRLSKIKLDGIQGGSKGRFPGPLPKSRDSKGASAKKDGRRSPTRSKLMKLTYSGSSEIRRFGSFSSEDDFF